MKKIKTHSPDVCDTYNEHGKYTYNDMYLHTIRVCTPLSKLKE